MKRILFFTLVLALALGISVPIGAHTESDPFTTELLAGQHIDVGQVNVWNNGDNLYVQYIVDAEGWYLLETHLHVATSLDAIPQKRGNPPPGQFDYSSCYDCDDEVTSSDPYAIPLEDWAPDTELYIAAHAVVGTMCEAGSTETAWGDGEDFPGRNWATYFMYTVQEAEIPSPGEDIVVFNDINPFDITGMENPNNLLMVQNLVNYVTARPRGSGTVVWFDRGRNCICAGTGECNDVELDAMRTAITDAGYSITDISSTSGSITNIPEDVKVVFLWNPMVPYTTEEINVFKQFADEGGRLVFIGEWDDYYGAGIALENQFLLDMGAVMTNIGLAVDCGYHDLPATSLRPHQITTGMDGVRIACASVIVPGPDDYPLFYDSTDTYVLAGVAKIDTTPLP